MFDPNNVWIELRLGPYCIQYKRRRVLKLPLKRFYYSVWNVLAFKSPIAHMCFALSTSHADSSFDSNPDFALRQGAPRQCSERHGGFFAAVETMRIPHKKVTAFNPHQRKHTLSRSVTTRVTSSGLPPKKQPLNTGILLPRSLVLMGTKQQLRATQHNRYLMLSNGLLSQISSWQSAFALHIIKKKYAVRYNYIAK